MQFSEQNLRIAENNSMDEESGNVIRAVRDGEEEQWGARKSEQATKSKWNKPNS